jgi:anti-sigma regulatory factor (Ser/Thr protein kinase)
MADGSPLTSRLALAAVPSAAKYGRLHVDDVLRRWGVPDLVRENATLVASELLGNAVKHARGQNPGVKTRLCTLFLTLSARSLTVAVHDTDRRPPVLGQPSWDAEGGRGLLMVEELSAKWGYSYPSPAPDSGKLVWAQLSLAVDRPSTGGARTASLSAPVRPLLYRESA